MRRDDLVAFFYREMHSYGMLGKTTLLKKSVVIRPISIVCVQNNNSGTQNNKLLHQLQQGQFLKLGQPVVGFVVLAEPFVLFAMRAKMLAGQKIAKALVP